MASLSLRPELATARLLLRRPNEGDVAAIVRIAGNREVARRLARVPHPYGLADAALFLDQVVPTEWVWGITILGCPELIGVVGLTPTESDNIAELGYWLAPEHWGKGIMTEAAQAIIRYGYEALSLTSIVAGYLEENPASGRVLEKLGFIETGRATRPRLATAGNLPSVEMSLSLLDLPAR